MFLRSTTRKKDGKEHRYWSVVENRRVSGNRTVQRHVLYLGEINDRQQAAWISAIEVFDDGDRTTKQVALFPEHRQAPVLDCDAISIRMSEMRLCRPLQWGACWLSCYLWDRLHLDEFWNSRLEPSRKGTSWLHVLKMAQGHPGLLHLTMRSDNELRRMGFASASSAARWRSSAGGD